MAIVLHSKVVKRATLVRDAGNIEADPAEYREFVFRCALAICGEPDGAEDVAQEVLVILFKTGSRLTSFENPTAWVRRVTVRCSTRYLKRRKSIDQIPIGLESAGALTDDLAVYEVLRRLTPENRALLGMSLNQGLSYREIADALGIPEGTVASRLSAAKKEFQRRWEQ